MAVRPHYPAAAAKQAAYRARKRQAARDLAAHECAAIQQALQKSRMAWWKRWGHSLQLLVNDGCHIFRLYPTWILPDVGRLPKFKMTATETGN